MTLKEAIESGLEFKRPHHRNWLRVEDEGLWWRGEDGGDWYYSISLDDIKATNWMVKMEPITITMPWKTLCREYLLPEVYGDKVTKVTIEVIQ